MNNYQLELHVLSHCIASRSMEVTAYHQSKADDIVNIVGGALNVPAEALKGSVRGDENTADGRHIAMYLIKRECNTMSLVAIGKLFSGRSHSTVIKGIEKTTELKDFNRVFASKLEQAEAKLKEALI